MHDDDTFIQVAAGVKGSFGAFWAVACLSGGAGMQQKNEQRTEGLSTQHSGRLKFGFIRLK